MPTMCAPKAASQNTPNAAATWARKRITTNGEDPETVEDAYEPYLILEGFLQRTPRGRIATERGYRHLGVDRDTTGDQGSLL